MVQDLRSIWMCFYLNVREFIELLEQILHSPEHKSAIIPLAFVDICHCQGNQNDSLFSLLYVMNNMIIINRVSKNPKYCITGMRLDFL